MQDASCPWEWAQKDLIVVHTTDGRALNLVWDICAKCTILVKGHRTRSLQWDLEKNSIEGRSIRIYRCWTCPRMCYIVVEILLYSRREVGEILRHMSRDNLVWRKDIVSPCGYNSRYMLRMGIYIPDQGAPQDHESTSGMKHVGFEQGSIVGSSIAPNQLHMILQCMNWFLNHWTCFLASIVMCFAISCNMRDL